MLWKWFSRSPPSETSAAPASLARPRVPAPSTAPAVPLITLTRLIPLGQLPIGTLKELNASAVRVPPGGVIFRQGDECATLIYLRAGKVLLESSQCAETIVEAETFLALYPLSSASLCQANAIAKTEVELIYVPRSVLQNHQHQRVNPLLDTLHVPEVLRENAFFEAFRYYFARGDLDMPSLPDVAFRLRSALQKDIGIAEAAKIINMDPVIASKLIKIVNSPLYRTVNPINSCHAAVNRLGLITTRNLVTSLSMRNLFKSTQPYLKKKAHQIWLQSVKVSSLSYTLAQLIGRSDPDEAMLAGLVHSIGALPILKFADGLSPDRYRTEDVETCIQQLQGHLGSLILKNWDFPNNLRKIPLHADDWFHDEASELVLSDVVILARFHSLIGTPEQARLPLLITLPAYQKLGSAQLTPDRSLRLLQDAKQQVNETMSFFA